MDIRTAMESGVYWEAVWRTEQRVRGMRPVQAKPLAFQGRPSMRLMQDQARSARFLAVVKHMPEVDVPKRKVNEAVADDWYAKRQKEVAVAKRLMGD